MSAKDLRLVTDGWPYEPGQVSVRRVRGADNRVKIQMRVDLGVLQMEARGRPDGAHPHGCDSLLQFQKERIEAYRRRNGTDLGFVLDPVECREIRDEALQYYQRYLANFVLDDFDAVAEDTQRNLDVLDMCSTYAAEDEDRFALEPYRPYILMMHAQSLALATMSRGDYRAALAQVQGGMRSIRDVFTRHGRAGAWRRSSEIRVLRALRREIQRYLPADRVRLLKRMLKKAVRLEKYEEAARLRDQLVDIEQQDHSQT
ncbi:MAG TPA: UvrB/UvrC motif-containing protein [Phycisphaerae bacterium]|nr:UvrB/UvrC motif-containing protein [Phycisphaerae bacterium]